LVLPTVVFSQQIVVTKIPAEFNGNVYSPSFYGEKIVVCSDQNDRISHEVQDEHGNLMIDLYSIDLSNNSFVERFDKTFKTDFHDGPITFSADNSIAIVSRNLKTELLLKGILKNKNLLGLYESHLIDGAWTEPVPLLFNDSTFSNTHPCLNDAGNILVFASNRPGGFGGYDLWKSEKIDGTWAEPINLGENINSNLDDVFPSICENELYFSSSRKVYGGLDIYKSCLGEECKAVCLDEPINSTADDFGLISNDLLLSGYLSSNRSSMDKVYSFKYDFPTFEDCNPLIEDNFCYSLFDENAYELDNLGPLKYRWKINEDVRFGVQIDYCFPSIGEYEITIDIIDTILNIVYAEQDYYILNIEYEEQAYISTPDTVNLNEPFVLSSDKTFLPGFSVIEEYWYLSDGAKYIGKNNNHAFTAIGEYEVQLGMIGVIESGDTIKRCTIKKMMCSSGLTENKDALAKKQINQLPNNFEILESRISQKESENDSIDVLHTIELTSSNKIPLLEDTLYIDFTNMYSVEKTYNPEDSLFTYRVGEWTEIENAYPTWKELIGDGYKNPNIKSYDDIRKLQTILLDSNFILTDALFETNKWDIVPESEIVVKKVVKIMQQHPEFKLIISAFTDNIGNNKDNLVLSDNRASSVYKYLVEMGIPASSIIKKSYGEKYPVATNETPEGRLKNRRIEFEIITEEK